MGISNITQSNGNNGGRRGAQQRSLAEINITPLCDVLLVLLIIFMVTAPLLTQGIDVNLPQTKAPEVQQKKTDVVLTMRKANNGVRLFLGNGTTPIADAYLERQLRETFAEREEKDLFLRADQDVRYGEVARVMAIAKLAGIERIGMMTRPEGE